VLGRPKKPLEERRRNKVQVSFTDAEAAEVERAAGEVALGSWVGEAAVKVAKAKNRKRVGQ
jgi:hypothetical protein